jgi:hypothetical protein
MRNQLTAPIRPAKPANRRTAERKPLPPGTGARFQTMVIEVAAFGLTVLLIILMGS